MNSMWGKCAIVSPLSKISEQISSITSWLLKGIIMTGMRTIILSIPMGGRK